jgi:two-component system cell cycle response regulator
MTTAIAADDPLREEDTNREKERAAAFWAASLALVAVLQVVHPPTVPLGPAIGLGLTVPTWIACILYTASLRRAGRTITERELLVGAVVGSVSLGFSEWLCGGVQSQLHLVFPLIVFGCAAVVPRRGLVAYLVVVTLVLQAPVLYEPWSLSDVAVMAAFALLLWTEGLLTADFRTRLQAQRFALLEAERASAGQASTDALTGLGNRRALEASLAAAHESGAVLSVVYLDLNGFKSYNDQYGHAAGDALLRRLGHALSASVDAGGHAFRVGGDEFCVLLDDGMDREHPAITAVVDALSELGAGFSIAPSFGVVVLPRDAADPDAALRLADERMYAHKRGGRPTAAEEMSALLLRVVAEREPGLHDHVVDVVDLAQRVGRRLNCCESELDVIARAAEQHDIGKLAVPDAILRKPGPLDDDEWALIRQHTVVGERILAGTPSLRSAARLVRSSHEHWDGQGYPDGLAGDAIPLGARIIAGCDAFSAMVHDRPYRPALGRDAALAELRRDAGTQFDPVVVEAVGREAMADAAAVGARAM